MKNGAYKTSLAEKIQKTYFTKDFVLFVFCGGMGTLTNFIVSLIISAALNPSIAYVLGYAISLFTAYTLNAKLIFKSRLGFGQFIKFVISYIPNFLILFSFVLVFLNILKWHKVIVYALSGLLGLPLTFVLVKLMVFRKPDKKIIAQQEIL
ncbi:GtrA family protein [Breznakiellaceae bacterium SP9]